MSKQRGYMPKAESVEWETPIELITQLQQEFGKFDLDVAANHGNAKATHYYTKDFDGLTHTWWGSVFCNPPHTLIAEFVKKASEEIQNCEIIVMLLPSRTDTRWFHDYLYQKNHIDLCFLKGRLTFKREGKRSVAPFPSMLAIFKNCLVHAF